MDRKLPKDAEIQRLIRLSQASRRFLETEATALRHRLDVPSRIRDSLKLHPSAWMVGAMVSGLFASALFRRKAPATKRPRGVAAILLGLTLTAARPMAKVWFANQLKQWLTGLASAPPAAKPATLRASASHSIETSNSF